MTRIEIGVILALCVALFMGGWEVRGWRDKAAQEAKAEAMVVKMNAIELQAQADAATYEQQRAAAGQTIKKLNKQMETYRAKNSIPADCFIPADGMLAVTSAVKASSAR